jgi:hypothetical protein
VIRERLPAVDAGNPVIDSEHNPAHANCNRVVLTAPDDGAGKRDARADGDHIVQHPQQGASSHRPARFR